MLLERDAERPGGAIVPPRRVVDGELTGERVAAAPVSRDVHARPRSVERPARHVQVCPRSEDVPGRRREVRVPPVSVGAVDAKADVLPRATDPDVVVGDRVRPVPALADVVARVAVHRDARVAAVRESFERGVTLRSSRVGEPQRRVSRARRGRSEADPDLARRLHQRVVRAVVLSDREGARVGADDRDPGNRHRPVVRAQRGGNRRRGAAGVGGRPPESRGREQRGVARRGLTEADLAEGRRPAALAVLLVDEPEAINSAIGDVDVTYLEEAAVLVAAAAGSGDIDPGMAGLAEGSALRPDVVAGRERLARRCGEVHAVGVPGGASRDRDGEVAGVARDADRRVGRLEEALRPAADVVAGVAEHRYERRRRSRRDRRPRERAGRGRNHRDD